MTKEFKIRFSFQNRFYNARVVKSDTTDRKTYAVRPFSLRLAKQFGPQTLIFKQDNLYRSDSMLSSTMPEYIKAIVSALEQRRG